MEIVNNPERIAAEYKKIWSRQIGNERRHFDLVRDRFNQTERPEDLLYLLARCVKAAVRYNSRGHFNNSPDNRRLGAQPERMSKHIYGMSLLLRERTEFSSVDYSAVLSAATDRDLVYMDPPYQGVCNTANHRYVQAIESGPFIEQLRDLNARGVPFILSYDGRTGTKTFGPPLPEDLMLCHLEVPAGRSSQATLLGRDSHTFESIYLSPALLDRLGGNPAAVLNNSSFEEQHLWPVT